MKEAKCLTITYLTKASYASLNGSDKEADNISSIKKIQMTDGKEYPYCSSQAVRRALREQLGALGFELSEGVAAAQAKGADAQRQADAVCVKRRRAKPRLFAGADYPRGAGALHTHPHHRLRQRRGYDRACGAQQH